MKVFFLKHDMQLCYLVTLSRSVSFKMCKKYFIDIFNVFTNMATGNQSILLSVCRSSVFCDVRGSEAFRSIFGTGRNFLTRLSSNSTSSKLNFDGVQLMKVFEQEINMVAIYRTQAAGEKNLGIMMILHKVPTGITKSNRHFCGRVTK